MNRALCELGESVYKSGMFGKKSLSQHANNKADRIKTILAALEADINLLSEEDDTPISFVKWFKRLFLIDVELSVNFANENFNNKAELWVWFLVALFVFLFFLCCFLLLFCY